MDEAKFDGATVDDAPVSIGRRLHDLAVAEPDRVAFVHVRTDGSERAYTRTELDRGSSALAAEFARRGLGFGARLGIALPNSGEFALSAYAAWKLGAVPVPMRWDLPEWELERLREVVDGPLHVGQGDEEWIRDAAAGPVPELPDAISPQVNGICSSGSTGLPKIVVGNKPGVFDALYGVPFAVHWGVEVARPQQVIVLGPMYHVNGFSCLFQLLAGDNVVVMEKFDAARVVDLIERHRISTFNCTPTMLKRIADLPDIDTRDLSSIRVIVQGAAPMPPYLARKWIDLVGGEHIFFAYGMSEALGITAARGDEYRDHPGTVGRGLHGTEVRILDPMGEDVPVGEVGEIHLRSPVHGGSTYLGAAPQLSTTPDGFSSVGDLGRLDEDGFLYVVDRRVDLIISGGANVFPAEVEIALMDHPKVADVVVIGLRDDEWGRRVHAIVAPADPDDPPTFEEVRTYAKSRLAPYKVSKSLEVLPEIPRSAATKVNRGALVAERGG
ncbi:MAG: class I adenylate-forming enzyme family protein [Acidimicrobiia bacterium]